MVPYDDISDMSQTPEELAAADEGAGFNLVVPEKAKAGRKGGVARWTEFVRVTDAYRDAAPGNEGQERVLFTLQYVVIPGAESDANVDRNASLFMRVNPKFARGVKAALGQGDEKKEKLMHAMSMKKLKQLMVASGLTLDEGLSPETIDAMFPQPSASENGILIGRTFAFIMKDNERRKTNNDENSQDVDNILAAPEGV